MLWVNGPFGVGKTTACKVLLDLEPQWRQPNLEVLGSFLRDAERTPPSDYQQHHGWVALAVTGLVALAPTAQRPVVVPMSVLNEVVWEAIARGVSAAELTLRHVVLDAAPEEISRRIELGLTRPGDEEGDLEAEAWRRSQLGAFAAALPWLRNYAEVLDTTELSPQQVAVWLAAQAATPERSLRG